MASLKNCLFELIIWMVMILTVSGAGRWSNVGLSVVWVVVLFAVLDVALDDVDFCVLRRSV